VPLGTILEILPLEERELRGTPYDFDRKNYNPILKQKNGRFLIMNPSGYYGSLEKFTEVGAKNLNQFFGLLLESIWRRRI